MKILFFLSLLANLAFFFWQSHEGGFQIADNQELKEPAGSNRQIQLLSELEPVQTNHFSTPLLANTALETLPKQDSKSATQVSASSELEKNTPHPVFKAPEKSQPIAKKNYCYQVGGFTDKTAVNAWLKQQSEIGKVRRIRKNKLSGFDYQVFYPAARHLAESEQNLQRVKNAGVHDVFLVKEKPFYGDLSFGIFNEQNRAINRQKELTARGIYSSLRKRPKMNSAFYLQIQSEKNKKQFVHSLKNDAGLTIEMLANCR